MRFNPFWEDIIAFSKCIKIYSQKRTALWAEKFETSKDYLVDFLISRRGVNNRPFLHLSLVMLVTSGVVTAPIIASTYPEKNNSQLLQFTPPSAVLGALTTASQETATVISDKPRDQVIDYAVQKGDTLGAIADKFGVSVDTIKWANDLKTERLSIGQTLKVPPVTGIVYKVKAGDTIYSIAKYYKTDAQKIVNFPFNDYTDLDTFALAIGQTLIVPDGVMPEAKPVIAPSIPVSQIAGGSGQFMWPTGGAITQYPVWYHMALDIANSAAPAIQAAGEGTVILVQRLKYDYGLHVIIDNGGGLSTLYAHMQEVYVEVGQSVSRGQVIGRMGSTGRSTGTHLHFEVRKNGVIVNPLPFLK